MPYYYSSNPTATPMNEGNARPGPGPGPGPGSNRQISLSLKDLDASVISVTFDENYPSNRSPEKIKEMEKTYSDDNLRSSYKAVDSQEQKYQQNVEMLLNKSSGSKYEEMIKKFLASKGEGRREHTLGGVNIPMTPRGTGNNIDQISLLESSCKLAERAAARQSKSALLRRSQQQTAAAMEQEALTEVLAQPLERNKYVPPNRSGTPTNLRGRQRAPPRTSHSPSPINSTDKYRKSKASRSLIETNIDMEGSRSVSVSLDHFNQWIEGNKSWQEKVEEKKSKIEQKCRENENLAIHSPQLSSSVKMYAEKSFMRKHSLSRGRSPGPTPRRSAGTSPHWATHDPDSQSREIASEGMQSMQLGELDDNQTVDETEDGAQTGKQDARYEKDVFRRLYDEGRKFNEFNETMDFYRSSGRLVTNALTFSPQINRKSSAIMAKRSTSITNLFRSCSPSSYRMSEISKEDRQRHAAEAHRNRVRSMSPANLKERARESVSLRGSTISKSYLSTKGGKMYPEKVVESILAEGKVNDVLCSSRSRSRQNADSIIQHRKNAPSYSAEILSDGGKMYETRNVSKESKRINSRNETSFEDRMLKSMDEYRIKVKINRESSNDVTPGPGQYANVVESNRCCPLPKSSTPDKQGLRSKVRGSKSYSFGRTRRELL